MRSRIWLRMVRDERGFFVGPLGWLAGGLIVATLVAAPILIGGAHDISDLMAGRWNKKELVGRSAPSSLPFIGPGLPDDSTKAACVRKAAGDAGLVFGPGGWRAQSVYPEPTPPYSQAAVDTWAFQMNSYVKSRADEWAGCLKDEQKPEKTTTTEEVLVIAGNYTLNVTRSGNPDCDYALPTSMRVTAGGGGDLGLTTVSADGNDGLTGSVDRGYGFSANGLRQVGGGLGIRMLGRFAAGDGGGTIIQNGALEYLGPTQCSFDFTGTRTSS